MTRPRIPETDEWKKHFIPEISAVIAPLMDYRHTPSPAQLIQATGVITAHLTDERIKDLSADRDEATPEDRIRDRRNTNELIFGALRDIKIPGSIVTEIEQKLATSAKDVAEVNEVKRNALAALAR